jgi:hypothetical protein
MVEPVACLKKEYKIRTNFPLRACLWWYMHIVFILRLVCVQACAVGHVLRPTFFLRWSCYGTQRLFVHDNQKSASGLLSSDGTENSH